MRKPSRLFWALAACYLVPAAGLDILTVRDMGRSYGFFDTLAMIVVSAPAGIVTVSVFEHSIPLDRPAAWFLVLFASQCANVLLAWGLVRGTRLAVRAAGWAVDRLVWGPNPPGPEEAARMRRPGR